MLTARDLDEVVRAFLSCVTYCVAIVIVFLIATYYLIAWLCS